MTYGEIIAYIRERGFFDLMANEYYKLSKEQLAYLAKEMAFAIYSLGTDLSDEATEILIDTIVQDHLE